MKLGMMCLFRWSAPLLLIWSNTFARGGTSSRNSSKYKFIILAACAHPYARYKHNHRMEWLSLPDRTFLLQPAMSWAHAWLAWNEVRSREDEKKLIEENEFRLNHPHLSEWKEASTFLFHRHQLLTFSFEDRSPILPPLSFPAFWGTQSYWANSSWYF